MHLQLDRVSKVFGQGASSKLVLEDISFQIKPGEFVALVGSSGSGKSTVMRLVAGLERPTAGAVLVDGQPVRGPGSDRGMVFQKYSLYPWLTAAQNVAFGMELKGRGRAEIRERTAYFLEVVGLAGSAALYPRELSGGMQQRVSICRALIYDPELLLMDEPFGALDAMTREDLSFELLRIWDERKKTVVFVTHSIAEAVLLADRVIVMTARPGKVVMDVPITLPRPRTPDTEFTPEFSEFAKTIRAAVYAEARGG